jgi:hypothetical protein
VLTASRRSLEAHEGREEMEMRQVLIAALAAVVVIGMVVPVHAVVSKTWNLHDADGRPNHGQCEAMAARFMAEANRVDPHHTVVVKIGCRENPEHPGQVMGEVFIHDAAWLNTTMKIREQIDEPLTTAFDAIDMEVLLTGNESGQELGDDGYVK